MKETGLCQFCGASPSSCGVQFYQPKHTIKITTQFAEITVLPTDRYRCSDEMLKIFRQEAEFRLPWNIITDVRFDDTTTDPPLG